MMTSDLAAVIQKTEAITRGTLEKLVETGLVEAHGVGRGRTYTLSANIYRHSGQKAAYIRQAGFDLIQQEQMILGYIDKHGTIKRADVAELCRLKPAQAYRLLNSLKKKDLLRQTGQKRHAFYTRNT